MENGISTYMWVRFKINNTKPIKKKLDVHLSMTMNISLEEIQFLVNQRKNILRQCCQWMVFEKGRNGSFFSLTFRDKNEKGTLKRKYQANGDGVPASDAHSKIKLANEH